MSEIDPIAATAAPIEADPVVSRRLFLRTAMAITGAVAVGIEAEYTDATISRTLLAPEAEDIATAVPAELQGVHIDHTNEHYQPDFTAVLTAGIETYKQKGGTPYYRKPHFYLGEIDMLRSMSKQYMGSAYTYHKPTEPYEKLLHFTMLNPNSAESLLNDDPGSSTKPIATQRVAGLGAAADKLTDENNIGSPSIGDAAIITAYHQTFDATLSHLDTIRQGGKVSTSELYAYYLAQNKGDMVTSLVDTTIFLKMAARTDMSVLTGDIGKVGWDIAKPTYANAQLISERFYDDFSSSLPLNKLMQAVGEKSPVNNFDIDEFPAGQKDYDPINRAGTPYHIWNIFTLAACAEPATVQQLLVGYYNAQENRYDTTKTQGRIKVESDMRAMSQVRQMHDVFDQYAVS